MRMLGGLELLWDQTRAHHEHQPAHGGSQPERSSTSASTTSAKESLAAPPWAKASPLPPPLIGPPPATASASSNLPGDSRNTPLPISPRSAVSAPQSSRSIMPLLQPTPSHLASSSTLSRLSSQAEQPSPASSTASNGVQQLSSPQLAPPRRPSSQLSNYSAPRGASFEQLVLSNVLPLPPVPTGLNFVPTGSLAHQYASRCHELRLSVRKRREGEAGRTLSREEMVFWNKLCKL